MLGAGLRSVFLGRHSPRVSAIIGVHVDHSCHKCEAPVESGVAFCPHCHAPQIRVPVGCDTTDPATVPDLAAPSVVNGSFVHWPQALSAAAIAGILSAFLMNLFFGFFGVGIAAAGALAVSLYRRRTGPVRLSSGAGARIGAVSGLFGFGFFCLLIVAATAIFRGGSELKTALLTSLQQAAARSQDPQAQAALEKLRTPEGLMFVLAFGLAFVAFLFIALSALGGALAASMGRTNPPR